MKLGKELPTDLVIHSSSAFIVSFSPTFDDIREAAKSVSFPPYNLPMKNCRFQVLR
jgi:hypothetical protein